MIFSSPFFSILHQLSRDLLINTWFLDWYVEQRNIADTDYKLQWVVIGKEESLFEMTDL